MQTGKCANAQTDTAKCIISLLRDRQLTILLRLSLLFYFYFSNLIRMHVCKSGFVRTHVGDTLMNLEVSFSLMPSMRKQHVAFNISLDSIKPNSKVSFISNYSECILVHNDKWAAPRKKVPNVLSRCHTKRRTGAWGRASPSFGMTPTF